MEKSQFAGEFQQYLFVFRLNNSLRVKTNRSDYCFVRMESGAFVYIAKDLLKDDYIVGYTNYVFDDMLRLKDINPDTILVYYEYHDDTGAAASRHKRLKNWQQNWLDRIVEGFNPNRKDLIREIREY